MKRVFALALLSFAMLVCSSVMAAQPKAEDMLGKWQVSPEFVSKILGEVPQEMGNAKMDCCFEFCENAKALAHINAQMQIAVETGIEMILDFGVLLNCSWVYADDLLFVEYSDIDVTLNKIQLVPENHQFEVVMEMMKPQIYDMFSSMIKDAFKDEPLIPYVVVDIEGDVMTLSDKVDGEALVLTRVVE